MMICKNCRFEITDKNNKFCPNCGSEIERPQQQNEDLEPKVENVQIEDEIFINRKAKIVRTIIGIVVLVIIAIVLIYSITYNSSTNKMKSAIETHSAYEVNSLYSEAYGDSSKIEKYDEAISELLDDVISDLNSKVYSEDDLIENGYTVVSRDLKNDWGNLVYTEEGESIYPSISYYNEGKWDRLMDLVNSRFKYCAGVCYLNGYNEPENAIDSFKQVIEGDSYFGSAQERIAESADMYVQQVLEEADTLVASGDISGAISKLNSINTYLENNGISTDSVQQKLDETFAMYAKTYYEKAEASFKDKDIDGAIGNIEVALKLQPENTDYISKRADYEQYLPYELYIRDNVLNTEVVGVDFYFNKSMESNDNKQMDHSIEWEKNTSIYGSSSYTSALNYNLAGKYDSVTGTIFLSKESKNTGYKAYFTVYGDGKLLYTSPTVTGGVLPQEVVLNVTGVHKLKIEFYGEGAIGFPAYFGVSNLIAQKEFPN